MKTDICISVDKNGLSHAMTFHSEACVKNYVHRGGGRAWLWGACMVAGDVHGCGEVCVVAWGVGGVRGCGDILCTIIKNGLHLITGNSHDLGTTGLMNINKRGFN